MCSNKQVSSFPSPSQNRMLCNKNNSSLNELLSDMVNKIVIVQ